MFFIVCSTSKRSATSGIHLVRRTPGFQKKEHGPASSGDRQDWAPLPHICHRVYSGSPYVSWSDHEEAFHQVHLSFYVLLHFPR